MADNISPISSHLVGNYHEWDDTLIRALDVLQLSTHGPNHVPAISESGLHDTTRDADIVALRQAKKYRLLLDIPRHTTGSLWRKDPIGKLGEGDSVSLHI